MKYSDAIYMVVAAGFFSSCLYWVMRVNADYASACMFFGLMFSIISQMPEDQPNKK